MAKMSYIESLFVNSYFDYLLHKFVGMEKLLQVVVKEVPDRILEVGCGSGITTQILANKFPNAEIIAIDLDESQITRAKKRQIKGNVQFIQGDATKLQFPNGGFDACFASFAFHHMPCFPQSLSEIHRVLRDGSNLYVIEIPFSLQISSIFNFDVSHEEVENSAKIDRGFFTKKKLLQEIKLSGFRIISLTGLVYLHLECERI